MLKHLLLLLALGWSLTAGADYDNFQADKGGNGPPEEVTKITITVILSPSDEETTRICKTKTPAAGCTFKDGDGNQVIVIPDAQGWDDFYSLCIAGHELYHAIGANHTSGIGCPYPYVDENNVARSEPEKPPVEKKEEKKVKKEKTNKK